MRCPQCEGLDTRVIDTTPSEDEIRRRRECQDCGHRFTTVERTRSRVPLVVKQDTAGMPVRRESFDSEKLRHGIAIACAKRPISQTSIDRIVEGIEAQLEALNIEEVASKRIGEMVMDSLREVDPVAYIRYAIVFLGFDDLAAIREEIDHLLLKGSSARSLS